MKLHLTSWGDGARSALLVHGLVGDGGTWGRLASALVERGYKVIAPDLRGHGLSPRGSYSHAEWAADLVESLPRGVDLAIGHSLGALALRLAADELQPRRVVHIEPTWIAPPPASQVELAAAFASEKGWGRAELMKIAGKWHPDDVEARLVAMAHWDPATASGLMNGASWDYAPVERAKVPSLIMLADASRWISASKAEDLTRLGHVVRWIAGAGHSIHREDLPGLLACLDEWLANSA